MAAYTHKNLKDVKDQAVDFGFSPQFEARFARGDLGAERTGLSYQRLAPDTEAPFGHRHESDEEVYVVLEGSGRMKLGDDVVDIGPLDAVRVAPETPRTFLSGPEGLALLAFGTHTEDDAEVLGNLWEE